MTIQHYLERLQQQEPAANPLFHHLGLRLALVKNGTARISVLVTVFTHSFHQPHKRRPDEGQNAALPPRPALWLVALLLHKLCLQV